MRGLLVILGVLVVGFASAQSPKPVVQTWQALKFKEVVKQGLDYSCGSASMATILHYYFGDAISEAALTMDMTVRLSKEELASRIKDGFSLLDMRDTLVRLGYQAVGAKLTLSQAEQLKEPIVVLLRRDGINHFVVLKGTTGHQVEIADPTLGNIKLTINEFEHYWHGEVLAIGKPGSVLGEGKGLRVRGDLYSPAMESVRSWQKHLVENPL
jgi:hypothetical protein